MPDNRGEEKRRLRWLQKPEEGKARREHPPVHFHAQPLGVARQVLREHPFVLPDQLPVQFWEVSGIVVAGLIATRQRGIERLGADVQVLARDDVLATVHSCAGVGARRVAAKMRQCAADCRLQYKSSVVIVPGPGTFFVAGRKGV